MSAYTSQFLQVLHERGFIHQMSNADGLDALLNKETMTAYIGFDCTAPSLHIGNLVQIMLLYWFQQTGHWPLALMGGGTSMIGDPSGKDESRQLLTLEKIELNKSGIRQVFANFLDFGNGKKNALMPDNAEWLMSLNYVEFLREYGKNFSVNQMLARDSVKNRLGREQHLSFLEFNYMIFQAYDFVELNKRYDCRLQMGGSDQWGNIVSGVDLGRRSGTPELFALTTPLLTTSSGAKMGKTADGAVWLSKEMRSPYEYWQYWRNCEDADIARFMKLFTTMPLDEIARYEALQGAEINEAKKMLATAATAMVHGKEQAHIASETARQTFEEGTHAQDLPTVEYSHQEFVDGIGVLSALVSAGFASSNGEARRHIKGGAAKINDQPVNDEKMVINSQHLNDDGVVKLSMGKKRHALLRPK